MGHFLGITSLTKDIEVGLIVLIAIIVVVYIVAEINQVHKDYDDDHKGDK